MRVLRDLGLDFKRLRLNFYPNHEELRRALERGDVDVIGTYWDQQQQTRFPDWHQLEIGGVKEGLNWFLANSVFDDIKERCAVIKALDELTDASGKLYFAQLRFTREAVEGCDER
jgi:hypothetical protein